VHQHRHLAAMMAIPTKLDGDLGALDDAAASVLVQLRIMNHAAPGDVPNLRAALRERLRNYVDRAMDIADEVGAR
jgi:hypothetical protein